MYLGRIVEEGSVDELFDSPAHPYTKFLISAVPLPEPQQHDDEPLLEGDIPSPLNIPSGCCFHTRCPVAEEICKREVPALIMSQTDDDHQVACHLAGKFDSLI